MTEIDEAVEEMELSEESVESIERELFWTRMALEAALARIGDDVTLAREELVRAASAPLEFERIGDDYRFFRRPSGR